VHVLGNRARIYSETEVVMKEPPSVPGRNEAKIVLLFKI
jgi:hypothetical protein